MRRLPPTAGLLFLAGCPRTGTTALQEYLNVHPEVMVCRERYKWVPPATITRERFEPNALLEFDLSTERYRTDTRRRHMEAILAAKDVSALRWVGDKFPGYLRSLDTLAAVNPGARVLLTHRGIEAVVNSYLGRARNDDDSWLGGRDVVDLAINTWNRSLLQVQAAVERPDMAALVVPYDEFHGDPAAWAETIGGFLDIEMPSGVVEEWRKRSADHEPTEDLLTDEIRLRIDERADRDREEAMLRAAR